VERAGSLARPVMPRRLVDRLPPLLLLALPALVLAKREVPQLALQLAIALEAGRAQGPVRRRRRHRAAGLLGVRAVREAAGRGQGVDVRESAFEGVRCRPELQLAQPRSVDEERAGGETQQLAMGGGVAAA